MATTWLSGHVIGAICLETGAASFPEMGRACMGRGGELLGLLQREGALTEANTDPLRIEVESRLAVPLHFGGGYGGDQDGDEGENYLPSMWLEIAQELHRQAEVEGPLLDFFLFVEFRAHSVSNSALSSCRWHNSA